MVSGYGCPKRIYTLYIKELIPTHHYWKDYLHPCRQYISTSIKTHPSPQDIASIVWYYIGICCDRSLVIGTVCDVHICPSLVSFCVYFLYFPVPFVVTQLVFFYVRYPVICHGGLYLIRISVCAILCMQWIVYSFILMMYTWPCAVIKWRLVLILSLN